MSVAAGNELGNYVCIRGNVNVPSGRLREIAERKEKMIGYMFESVIENNKFVTLFRILLEIALLQTCAKLLSAAKVKRNTAIFSIGLALH